VSQDDRDKSGKKVCVTAVVRINPGTLVVYIAVERIKGGSPDQKSKLKLLISPKVTTTPFCGEQSFTVNSITTGDERRRFLPRSTWTHHAAAIKVTRPHHPAPTSTLAGDCSGRARSCPPATQHRKPSDPQCESDEYQLNNIPLNQAQVQNYFPPLRSYTALCTNPGLLNKKGCNSTHRQKLGNQIY
jgi:hypothetical protein